VIGPVTQPNHTGPGRTYISSRSGTLETGRLITRALPAG
jgi:hypothetical protein